MGFTAVCDANSQSVCINIFKFAEYNGPHSRKVVYSRAYCHIKSNPCTTDLIIYILVSSKQILASFGRYVLTVYIGKNEFWFHKKVNKIYYF